jgi:hypothetical protein
MDKFSRWINNDNVLFVVIAKYLKPIVEGGQVVRYEKTTVEMLEVHAEKMHEFTYEFVEKAIEEGRLKQILKPLEKK